MAEIIDTLLRKFASDSQSWLVLELTLLVHLSHNFTESLSVTNVASSSNDDLIADDLYFPLGKLLNGANVGTVAQCGGTIRADHYAIPASNSHYGSHLAAPNRLAWPKPTQISRFGSIRSH